MPGADPSPHVSSREANRSTNTAATEPSAAAAVASSVVPKLAGVTHSKSVASCVSCPAMPTIRSPLSSVPSGLTETVSVAFADSETGNTLAM